MDYVNGIEYRNAALEAIYHSEGRVTNIDGTLKYEYAIKDHLGNTRIMFCDRNGDGVIKPENAQEPSEVTQENHYYAFGMNMEFGGWANTPSVTDNLHQYNGKELNTDFGLNWNDYGARFYDPAIARWNVIDPMAEKMRSYSPYNYGYSNPIRFIDPTGMKPHRFLDDEDDLKGRAPGGAPIDHPERRRDDLRFNHSPRRTEGEVIGANPSSSSNKSDDICPTCPKSGALKKYEDDPNNLYTYDSENGIIFNGDKTAVIHGKGPEKEKKIGQKMAEGAALALDAHNTTFDGISVASKDVEKIIGVAGKKIGLIGAGVSLILAGNDIAQNGLNWSNGTSAGLAIASAGLLLFTPLGEVVFVLDVLTLVKDTYDLHKENNK